MAANNLKVAVEVNLGGNLSQKSKEYSAAVTSMSARSKAAMAAMRSSVASSSAAIDSMGNRAAVGVTAAGYAFNQTFLNQARQMERFKVQMKSLYGEMGGQQALAWAKQNAKDTVMGLNDVISAMATLKSYGANPIQLLPTLENAAAMNGWTADDFATVTDTFGKIFSNGKITDEYNDILTDRKLNLIAVLEKATGTSQAKLREMMTDGQLGKEAINLAMKQIAIDSRGASAEAMKHINGMISNAGDNWDDFQNKVMDAGVTTELENQLRAFNQWYDAANQNGEMDAKAKEFATTLISTIRQAKTAGTELYTTLKQIYGVTDQIVQAMGGWEVVIKSLMAVYVANKGFRMAKGAFDMGKGARDITKGGYHIGRRGAGLVKRGWNRLRGKKANPATDGSGIDIAGVADVQQVYVTNWPGNLAGGDMEVGGRSKKKHGRNSGKHRKRGATSAVANMTEQALKSAKSLPKASPASTAAKTVGKVAKGAGRTAMKGVPLVSSAIGIVELAAADNNEQRGEAIGSAAGAAAGAAIGSVILPGIGTVIGGLLGDSLGSWLGGMAGEMFDDKPAVTTPAAGASGGEVKVKVELSDGLKARSTQTTSWGDMGLYTGGYPLY